MRHPEHQYLDLLANVLEHGDERIDRTGVGTRSVFGAMTRFNVEDGTVPILTTKRVFWKTAIKEMLWFLSGETSIKPLLKNNVSIWTDWPLDRYRKQTGEEISQREFERLILDDDKFASEWADLGPVYGKQWRRWLGSDGKEHDQISELIQTIKSDPTSRRLLFHAWNVGELDLMALPPCHMVYQFFCTGDQKLSCILFQRSGDLLLGCPFNWTAGAVLLFMIAQQTGLEPKELIWFAGDVHLYLNHIEQARIQLQREPRPWPKLRLLRRPESIDSYRIEDFEVVGYMPDAPIKADVAV